MQLTLASDTALRALRALRPHWKREPPRVDLHDPDPSPRKRWNDALIDLGRFGIDSPSVSGQPVSICVSDQQLRLRAKGVRSVVHAGELPAGAFRDLGGGVFGSGPELLFVEYAAEHTLPEACLLGMELCGSFSRDARDPIEGQVTMGVLPVTSCEKIARFIEGCRRVRGTGPARRALRFVADNAWSPMEAAVAVMMMLPLEEYGYGLGRCSLNVRVGTENKVPGAQGKETRVPDILVDGTAVGLNYDGGDHLDLDSIVDAAAELGRNPVSAQPERFVNRAVAEVRAKVVDDLRRNRDLAAAGYLVFPVVKEDLYHEGGLDGVMWQVLNVLELQKRKDYSLLRYALESSFAAKERYRLLRGMIPKRDASLDEPLDTEEAFVRIDLRP